MHGFVRAAIVCVIVLIAYAAFYPYIIIINTILSLIIKNPPFIQDGYTYFPYASVLERHCDVIREEFKANYIPSRCIDESIPGFQISIGTKDKCWRTIGLKKQGAMMETTWRMFPETTRLLNHPSIHNAVFSILDGNVHIPPHTGYYKGYLRYHLGVEIPVENGKAASITCGGQTYVWKNCEGVLFDDMYLHSVKNPTSQRRVVLYLDILRNDIPKFMVPLYRLTNAYLETHVTIKHLVDIQHTQQRHT